MELDDLPSGVVVVATAPSPALIEPALLRVGRIEHVSELFFFVLIAVSSCWTTGPALAGRLPRAPPSKESLE